MQKIKYTIFNILGHSKILSHAGLAPVIQTPSTGHNLQITTPPLATQVPSPSDSLSSLLHRYPVMWQGKLALKTDQASVQLHFVFGNAKVATDSLPPIPCDGSTNPPPLRISQRMRLEQTQLEGVTRKMQVS